MEMGIVITMGISVMFLSNTFMHVCIKQILVILVLYFFIM